MPTIIELIINGIKKAPNFKLFQNKKNLELLAHNDSEWNNLILNFFVDRIYLLVKL